MTNQHPITLPPAILQKLRSTAPTSGWHRDAWIAEQAAQWGADQELEACCVVLARELICDGKHVATDLRMIRRPKPPSLKEQALAALNRYEAEVWCEEMTSDSNIIRRALEALPE
jgi:hypothetical protein